MREKLELSPRPSASVLTVAAVQVTTVGPSAAFSWLTVSATGEVESETAAHTFGTAAFTSEIANDLIIAKVGTNGSFDIRNEAGTADLVIDLVGLYGSDDCPYQPRP